MVDLASVAKKHSIPVLRTGDASAPDAIAWVRALAPDLLVCVGWTRLLSPAMLSIPTRGAVGFHASLLPRNRGRAPVNWAILRGETFTGNTMMMLAPGVDTGDIVDQREISIEPDDTCATVYVKVAEAGAQMLTRHLPALVNGTAPRRPQVVHSFERMLRSAPPRWGSRRSTARPPRCTTGYAPARVRIPERSLPSRQTPDHVARRRGAAQGDQPTPLERCSGSMARASWSRPVPARSGSSRSRRRASAAEPASDWFAREGLQPGCVFDALDAATQARPRAVGPSPE